MFASCDAVSSSNNQILICVIFHCCDFFNCYNIKCIHVLSDENKQYIYMHFRWTAADNQPTSRVLSFTASRIWKASRVVYARRERLHLRIIFTIIISGRMIYSPASSRLMGAIKLETESPATLLIYLSLCARSLCAGK